MKAINSSVRGASLVHHTLGEHSTALRAYDKRYIRRTERARLKMSLVKDLQTSMAADIAEERRLAKFAAAREYEKFMHWLQSVSGPDTFRDWAGEQCIALYQPDESRTSVFDESGATRVMIASCASVD